MKYLPTGIGLGKLIAPIRISNRDNTTQWSMNFIYLKNNFYRKRDIKLFETKCLVWMFFFFFFSSIYVSIYKVDRNTLVGWWLDIIYTEIETCYSYIALACPSNYGKLIGDWWLEAICVIRTQIKAASFVCISIRH